jgi:hypothetical protein
MGQPGKKAAKTAKMRSLRVSVAAPKKSVSAKAKKAADKPMSFTEWVENYVKMSKGNPV